MRVTDEEIESWLKEFPPMHIMKFERTLLDLRDLREKARAVVGARKTSVGSGLYRPELAHAIDALRAEVDSTTTKR